MEDSEKRKEMLKAMRMEATAAAQNDDGSTSLETSMNTAHLSNPLAETSTDQQESFETPRFDYYTQPMSAYSSFKRNKTPKQQYMSSPGHEIRSPVPQSQPSAPGTLGSDYPAHANHGGFQAAHYNADNSHTGPREMSHISPSHRGSTVAWNNNFRPLPVYHNNFRPPPVYHMRPPHLAPYPRSFSQEGPDMGTNRFDGRGSTYNNTPPQFPQYGQQNSNWRGNRYHGSARGRGRGRGTNTSFGRDGGGRSSMERFYSNSMTEDPWKYLKPVLWKSCSDGSSSSSNSTGRNWLPNSIAPKKPTVTSESSHLPSNNKQSLAEFLADSLDEAMSNELSD